MTTVSTSVARELGTHLMESRTSLAGLRNGNLSDSERRGSVFAGALLVSYGLIRRSLPLTTMGAYLAYRGKTGRCHLYDSLGISSALGPAGLMTSFAKAVTVNRPREEIYRLFREMEDPFRALRHRHRETERQYVAKKRGGFSLPWELEATEARENELIAWTTRDDARLAIRYVLELEDATRNRGTVVRLRVSYVPPGGGPGAALGKLLSGFASRRASDDLRRMKQFLETGEIATTRGQPAGPSLRRRLGNPFWAFWRTS